MANGLVYLTRMWQLRYFWWSLARNDLSKRYKRSFLGIGWSLIRPLSLTVIFCVVFGKLLNQSTAEYAPFLLLGMTIWQFISESIMQGCSSFHQGATYIRQQQVPLAIFPLRTVLGSGFHALVALLAATAIVFIFKGSINPAALLYLIPGIVVLFLVAWFLAIISGVMQTHFPDTHHLLEIGLQITFYVTPILFKPEVIESRARLTALVHWNPFSSLLALVRAPLLEGLPPTTHQILMSLCMLLTVAGLAVLLLRKLERTLVFWV